MGRPISGEYRLGRQLLFGVPDPSGLDLHFELEPSRVVCTFDPSRHQPKRLRVVPSGLIQAVCDDLAHATIAALKKRLGVIRESRVRFLRPLYAQESYRAGATLAADADEGVLRIAVEFKNGKGAVVIDGEVQVFLLSAEQVRRMSPDGMIPLPLQRFFPG